MEAVVTAPLFAAGYYVAYLLAGGGLLGGFVIFVIMEMVGK
jgi:hypothetical protein